MTRTEKETNREVKIVTKKNVVALGDTGVIAVITSPLLLLLAGTIVAAIKKAVCTCHTKSFADTDAPFVAVLAAWGTGWADGIFKEFVEVRTLKAPKQK